MAEKMIETDPASALSPSSARTVRNWLGLFLGPGLMIGLYLLGPPQSLVDNAGGVAKAQAAWTVLGLLALMATWWVTEAIPIPVTALLPLVVLPLARVQSIDITAQGYMNKIVVLLMGGFIIAKAIERWNLHRRIALTVVARAGSRPSMLVAGFMFAAAALSMWISNTATSIMLAPIALSVAAAVVGPGFRTAPFTYALLLGVAYACSIGGLGTPVGTPTNLIIIDYLNENAGFVIDFGRWMLIGIPSVILLVPLAWLVLTRVVFRLPNAGKGEGDAIVREQLAQLGPMTTPERRTLIVFAVVATLWIFRRPLSDLSVFGVAPFGGLTDHVTAILGVILCFLIPSGSSRERGAMLLDWRTAETIPWGVVLLFGGGMSLAFAIRSSGLGDWVGGELAAFTALPILVLMLLLAAFVIFLTEVTSNVATAAALMPVLGAVALESGLDIELLALPLALAASCAFMLPMATGPNAVIFSTGVVSVPTMARAGLVLNFMAIFAITAITYLLGPLVLR